MHETHQAWRMSRTEESQTRRRLETASVAHNDRQRLCKKGLEAIRGCTRTASNDQLRTSVADDLHVSRSRLTFFDTLPLFPPPLLDNIVRPTNEQQASDFHPLPASRKAEGRE